MGPPSGGCCLSRRRRVRQGQCMGLGNRPQVGASAPALSAELFCDELGRKYPHLMEWLTQDRWDDGVRRQLPTISLFVEHSAFKVFLNDRDLERSCCLTGATLGQLLDTVEARLADGGGDWRFMPPKRRKA